MPEEILVNDADPAPVPVPDHRAAVHATTAGTIDVIDLGDGTCLVVYPTEADPRTMALMIGGGTAGALDELKRQMDDRPPPKGSR